MQKELTLQPPELNCGDSTELEGLPAGSEMEDSHPVHELPYDNVRSLTELGTAI